MSVSTERFEPPDFQRDLLQRLTERWGHRVAVKQDAPDLDGHFDPDLPDFPESSVPVLALPGVPEPEPEQKHRLLGAAWIAFNAKSSAVECEVILPACRVLLDGDLPGRRDEAALAALHQTIIDEHYHVLMCDGAAGVTRRRRGLVDLEFPAGGWSVVQGREKYRTGRTGTDLDLVDLAYGLAAETTINLLFSALASDLRIQPMNRFTVDLHRRDESGHSVVFRELARPLYRCLEHRERELFKDALLHGLLDFRAADIEPWTVVAGAAGIRVEPEEMVAWAASRPAPRRDTGPLQLLLGDLGLTGEFGPALDRAASG